MRRKVTIIAGGDVQAVGYREYVRKVTFKKNITGFVKNLESGDVEIVAEGKEELLKKFLDEINVSQYPVDVRSFLVTWEDATSEYSKFEIIRGKKDDELFERMDVAGTLLFQVVENTSLSLVKQDQMLEKKDQMLDKQDQMLMVQKETLNEIKGFRKDSANYLETEFAEIKKKLNAIENAQIREGIPV